MTVKTIYAEITNQCNLNCRTCYNRSGLNHGRRELSTQQLEEMIQRFMPYGLNRFLISGGEPTLHTQFNRILGLVEAYPELSFGIVTNGTNHNRKLIDIFHSHDNLTLQISLDGSCEAQNAKTRGAGHFDRVIDFVQKLRHSNKEPLLKMVISQNNFDDVEPFYRLAISLGCLPEFAFIYKSGNGTDHWDSKSLTAQQKVKVLRHISRLNSELNTEAFLPLCTSKCPYIDSQDNLSLCIKVDGSIQPCQMLYDGKYTLGNALAFDPDAFQGELNRIAGLAQNRLPSDYGCHKCLLNDCCGRGCMAIAANLTGDPLSNDGDCVFRKLQFLEYDVKPVFSGRL